MNDIYKKKSEKIVKLGKTAPPYADPKDNYFRTVRIWRVLPRRVFLPISLIHHLYVTINCYQKGGVTKWQSRSERTSLS